ncbi:alpha/beta hydrolase-fold protein [Micromonospora sp. DR5-3]|uniref:alpha/beta hydrolase n=1 Tax=unclassified Micromonospora TaxID=2617518 RepID=UPI0011D6BFC5|nr:MULTISPECIES: alpha/beta fold hydrolase [unclassified Micromonospora]MCW3818649.1 alpha/beta hydrolase-fold protein [Micromonospora sp. DR5-3]TYC21150.1 esterase [Micromonospora sp. MP36]
MGPDSLAAALTATTVAVAAAVLLSALWDRGAGVRRAAVRAATALLCLLTAGAAAGIWVNRQVDTWTSWSALLGRDPVATTGAAAPAAGHGGGRLVTLTVAGAASGLTLRVPAYLPAAYDRQRTQRFPVVEALHGYPGSPAAWLNRLAAARHLDQEITAGRMAPTVVLFPPQTPSPLLDTECTNLVGGPQAETFLTVDVPAAAEAQLRVRTDRAGWGLIGYSAGGYCATNLALRHPDRYAAAASLSGYADPGITIGDGSEHTLNDDRWRLRHLPPPAVALYLSSGRADRTAHHDAEALRRLARPPLTVTTTYVDGGGHSMSVWEAAEDPAFDWLSGWLGRPVTVT